MKKSRRKIPPKSESQAPSPPTPAYLERFRETAESSKGVRCVALGLAVITFVLGAWTFDAKLSLSGDNTEFITLARSLAQGTGLTHINTATPAAATKYPPGFPLLLAPMELLAPGSWKPMKWIVLVTFTAAVPLFFYLVRISIGTLPSLCASAICLTIPLLQEYAHQVMSEVPYLAFSVAALFLLQRSAENPSVRGNRWLLAAFVCTMAAYYIRTVGIVLIAAAVLHFLVRGEKKKGLVFFGAALLAWLPWTLRNRAVGAGGVYLQQLIQVNPYFPDQGLLDFGGFCRPRPAEHGDLLSADPAVHRKLPRTIPRSCGPVPSPVSRHRHLDDLCRRSGLPLAPRPLAVYLHPSFPRHGGGMVLER